MSDYDTGYQREAPPDPNEPLYRCPGGHGETPVEYVQIHDKHGQPYRAVRGCRQCDAGLTFDAGVWIRIMYHDQQGYLRFDEGGARTFAKFEREDPERAARVKERVLEIVDRRNKERQRKVEPPPGWGTPQ